MHKVIFILFVLVGIPPVCAGTMSLIGINPLNFGASLDIPANKKLGSVVASTYLVGSFRYNSMAGCSVRKTSTVNGTLVPGYKDVYQTNIPGVGIMYKSTTMIGGGYEADPVSGYDFTLAASGSGSGQFWVNADLIKVETVGSGSLTSMPNVDYSFSSSCAPTISVNETLVSGTIVNGLTSCAVANKAVTISLPDVGTRDLISAGATAGTTSGSIPLSCNAGTNVYVTFTDASNPANTSDVLSLAPSSTATNVGLQILYNGKPITYGPDSSANGNANQFLLGSSANLSNIPLMVRYYSRGDATAGIVRGVSTLTFSYQ